MSKWRGWSEARWIMGRVVSCISAFLSVLLDRVLFWSRLRLELNYTRCRILVLQKPQF